jgi:hypothetical protein
MFEAKRFFAKTAKYCSKECKDKAAQTRGPKKCKCCGKEFPAKGNAVFCDKACTYAFKAGITRDEWLEEHPQSNQSTLFKRKCHDCGKPTNNYRCQSCWEKLRSESETGGIPEYEVMGQAWA